MKKLETKTVRELMDLAREWGVSGYSKLKKAELVKLLASSKMVKKLKRSRQPANTASRTARQAAAKARKAASRIAGNKRPYQRPEAESKKAKAERAPSQTARLAAAGKGAKVEKGEETQARQKIAHTSRPGPTPSKPGVSHPVDSRMVLLVRDPTWLYCYWDLNPDLAEELWKGPQPYLRIVELRGAEGPREVQRFEVPPGARSWYIKLDSSGRTHRCELGINAADGEFQVMVHSNLSTSPPERLSSMRQARYVQHHPAPSPGPGTETAAASPGDESQAPADDALVQMSLSAGPGLDSAAAQAVLEERLSQSLASELLQSQALVEGSARPEQGRKESDAYWLWVDADIIIYGATVPGSKVTLRGVELPLDETGRFSARFALPDGELDMPVEGRSPKRIYRKRVRLRVERSTEADAHPRRIGS